MVVCNVVVGFVVGLGVALVFEFVLGPANCDVRTKRGGKVYRLHGNNV